MLRIGEPLIKAKDDDYHAGSSPAHITKLTIIKQFNYGNGNTNGNSQGVF